MKRRRFPSLTVQIMIGLMVGILIGWLEPGWGKAIKPMADIFLRMVRMIIAPLIFSTLVIGIAGTGDFKKVGRIGLKAIIYFEIATTIALLIGLATVNIFRPGQYVPLNATPSSSPARSASPLAQAGAPASAPVISSISPSAPTVGPGEQMMVVHGSQFQKGLTVTVKFPGGGMTVLSGALFQSARPDSFELTLTMGTAGEYTLKVYNPDGGQSNQFKLSAHQSGSDFLTYIFPASVVDAMAQGNILQLVIFSIFFGLALAAIGEKGRPLISVLNTVAETMFRFTDLVMKFAPLGVLAAIAATVGDKGLGVLKGYASLVLCFYGALVFFIFVVLFLVCAIIRVPFLRLFKVIREPFTIAFTTASSEAALPTAMESMERFGCPRDIVGFVLPTGYSFNLDGATLYLSLASIFIAQVFGIPLDVKTQLAMMLTLMLTSKGVAGVPRASLVILAGTVSSFNLPMEGIALLLGIDQILDMGRTATNVTGNCVATAVVARWEGVLDDEKMMAFEGGRAAAMRSAATGQELDP
jgi:Na+/H+-dicarboxylate symporter